MNNERVDDLLTHNLKIIQSKDVFSFSMDAVLLAHFATLPIRGRILDICSGNGVIPILLTTRTSNNIDAIEIQPKLVDMARRSVQLNRLEEQITVFEGDVRTFITAEHHAKYDTITMNPPYMPQNSGDINRNIHVATARHELNGSFSELVKCAAYLLKTGGKLAIVHRPSRIVDLLATMREHQVEPKRIRFVHPTAEAEANMVLIEGVRNQKAEAKILPPLIVYNEERQYTPQLQELYYPEK